MKTRTMLLATALLWPASAYADSFEVHYTEIKQWVVEPCAEVGAALAVRVVSQQDLDALPSKDAERGMRKLTAFALVQKQENTIRTMAAQMNASSTWEDRRAAYPLLLQMCVEKISGWSR